MPEPTRGGRLSLIPSDVIARMSGAIKGMLGSGETPTPNGPITQRREPWFGPGRPIAPMAPPQDVAGRRLDYPYGFNININARQYEGVSFQQLRALANYDLVRLAIETCKDQVSTVTGSVLPRMSQSDELRKPSDGRCQAIMDFLQYPDKRYDFPTWLRMLVDEQLTVDATSIYIRRTNGGDVYSLEQVVGDTIVPKLDIFGRMPLPPDIAYQQVLKGMPAINYSSDELLYVPRNPTVNRYLGFSPVEQIILTVNTAIRRGVQQLNHFTVGNVPDSIIALPKEWTATQVADFQTMWNALLASPENRDGQVRFVPGPMQFTPTRSDATLFGQFDEWLARVICYAFSLPNLPFVQQNNRATAETANERALEEGQAPRMIWIKGVMDRIIQIGFGYKDLEWVWDDDESIDTAEQARQDIAEMQLGLVSGDEIRAKRGLPPIGMTHMIWGIGPLGIIPVSDLNKALSQGLGVPQPPPPPMMPGQPMMGGPPGAQMPMLGASPDMFGQGDGGQMGAAGLPPGPAGAPPAIAPDADDALSGIPPELLAAVGLGPQGSAGRTVDVSTADEMQSDPLGASAAHPKVLQVLRAAQKRHGAKSQPPQRGSR